MRGRRCDRNGEEKEAGRAGIAALANGKAGGALHCRVCAQMVPLWRFIFYRPLVVSYKVFEKKNFFIFEVLNID